MEFEQELPLWLSNPSSPLVLPFDKERIIESCQNLNAEDATLYFSPDAPPLHKISPGKGIFLLHL